MIPSRAIFRKVSLLACAVLAAGSPRTILAQTAPQSPAQPGTQASPPPASVGDLKGKTSESSKSADAKSGEWVFAPIPISSPAIGSGLEWAVARLFPLNKKDEVSPASAVAAGGVFTNNGTRAFAAGSRLYLKEDKYRVTVALGTATVNADIYGIGRAAGENGSFVPLTTDGKGFFGEFLFRLRKGFYIGARGQYRNLSLSLNQEEMVPPDAGGELPEDVQNVLDQVRSFLLDQRTVSIGPRLQWDKRDSVFYPRAGLLADVSADFFDTGLGSKWTYQFYKASLNKYQKLNEHQVLAFRAMGCAAAGDRVPIYDLCLFGAQNDIRGYTAGRYQDRRMFAAQGEYRLTLPFEGFLGRFGVVAFGGFGGVGETFSEIAPDTWLPAGGAGARFRLTKKYPVNFRVDYAVGKVGNTLTIGILEAF